ncbi:MAG TPA: hypothetical protein VHX86_17630 [Tepidisphaeraceae bacterium]|jgi:hypothetical protein|nr:hypothetical protein [Tepidisphaeraceae bacterium]
MVNTNGEAARRDDLSHQPDTERVRRVIEGICTVAGAPVAIEERLGGDKDEPAQRRRLQVTYTGERPMPYSQWFKLVDSIDAALDPSGLIDWEFSELSEETEEERMAAWAILPAAAE